MITREYLKLSYKYAYKKYPLGKIRTIFADNWERYRKENKVRAVENENVLRMLSCRTPLLGSHLYICPDCGHSLEVPHTCKSRFCSVCGYIATANWIRDRFNFLLDCHYHHVVVTIPAYFRWIVRLDRTLVLNMFARVAADTLLKWGEERKYRLGIICFFHAFNKKMQDHPHFHFLVSAGGVGEDARWHYDDSEIPGHVLMKVFKGKFVSRLKKLFKKEKLKTNGNLHRVLYQISHQHDKHWQFHTQRITKEGTHTMEYCARYGKKTIISELRIINYDKKTVTFFDGKMKNVLDYPVDIFIKMAINSIPEKNFRLIRYYGFYSNKQKEEYAIAKKYWRALAQHNGRMSWQLRQMLRNYNDKNYSEAVSKDPLICPKCGIQLKLSKITYPEPKYKRTLENILIILDMPVTQKLIDTG